VKARLIYRIGTRLLLVNVLVVAVPILGIGFARFYEREMLRALEEDMVHQADLIREVVLLDPAGPRLPEREPLLVAAARNTRTRIRLLDPRGQLAADSHRQGPPEGEEAPVPRLLPSSEPHIASGPPRPIDVSVRSEVRLALRGEYGADTRLWEGGDRLFLFVALPVKRDGQVVAVVYVTRSTNPVRAAMYRLRATLLRFLAGSIAATAILSLLLATTISRPLGRLARIAGRIAAGDRTQRLALERRDEIGQLARALDTMARELDARVKDVGALAANLSHELKSPLTSMRGAAELLLEGAADDPVARQRFLENILADTHRLDRIVTRLLELSRLESDDEPRVVFDFEALVREVAESSVGPAPVEVHYTATRTQLHGVRTHLAAVLGNLLDNAQHHAAPDTAITIRVSDAPGGRLRVEVSNQGPPISEGNLPRIWDRFFTTRREHGGTGLGLPIVASVVAAHGGTVSVTSSAEDGTRFGFELPTTAD
jgi:two-component system sensor histidine kinase ChvG